MQAIGRSERNKDPESKSNGRALGCFSKVEHLAYFRVNVFERDHDEGVGNREIYRLPKWLKLFFASFCFRPSGSSSC